MVEQPTNSQPDAAALRAAGRYQAALARRRQRQESAEEEEPPVRRIRKISVSASYLMIGTALFFDLLIAVLNLIPFAGQLLGGIISVLVYGIFIFWFISKGVRLLKPKRVAAMSIGLLFSWTPLPAITASVAYTIYSANKED